MLQSERWLSFQSGPGEVLFFVRATNNQNTEGYLTYNDEVLNVGGAMNTKTGMFTAPTTATFQFSSSASCKYCQMHVYHNGVASFYFHPSYDPDQSNVDTGSISWVMKMEQEDTMQIYLDSSNNLQSTANYPTTLSGKVV